MGEIADDWFDAQLWAMGRGISQREFADNASLYVEAYLHSLIPPDEVNPKPARRRRRSRRRNKKKR